MNVLTRSWDRANLKNVRKRKYVTTPDQTYYTTASVESLIRQTRKWRQQCLLYVACSMSSASARLLAFLRFFSASHLRHVRNDRHYFTRNNWVHRRRESPGSAFKIFGRTEMLAAYHQYKPGLIAIWTQQEQPPCVLAPVVKFVVHRKPWPTFISWVGSDREREREVYCDKTSPNRTVLLWDPLSLLHFQAETPVANWRVSYSFVGQCEDRLSNWKSCSNCDERVAGEWHKTCHRRSSETSPPPRCCLYNHRALGHLALVHVCSSGGVLTYSVY